MKRIITACSLLTLLVLGCVWSHSKIRGISEDIIRCIEEDRLEEGYQRWNQSQSLLGAFIVHDELDSAEQLFRRLFEAHTTNQEDEKALDRAELIFYLEHLPELDELSIKNVL